MPLEWAFVEASVCTDQPNQITRLLHDVSAGDNAARGPLLEQVYAQLRAIAHERMSHERPGHTLQASALVHEAYLRLMPADGAAGQPVAEWQNRGHFYRAAAEAMRRVLIDHARRRSTNLRGGHLKRLPLSVCDLAADDDPKGILALDDAIVRLQEVDESAAEIVRLRFFAGLSVEQTAAALGISERTVKREWTYARAKLFRLLNEGPKE